MGSAEGGTRVGVIVAVSIAVAVLTATAVEAEAFTDDASAATTPTTLTQSIGPVASHPAPTWDAQRRQAAMIAILEADATRQAAERELMHTLWGRLERERSEPKHSEPRPTPTETATAEYIAVVSTASGPVATGGWFTGWRARPA